MNTTQLILLLSPVALAYLYWVWKGQSNNRINHWANLFSGVIVVPLFLGFTPFILLSVFIKALATFKWREGLVPLVILLLFVGYGAVVILAGDPPPPSPVDLPLER